MVSKEVSVNIAAGSDVGPVAELIQIASQYKSVIHVVSENKHVNAKSLMGMMSLGIATGETVKISADGEDAEEAIAAIEQYLGTEE